MRQPEDALPLHNGRALLMRARQQGLLQKRLRRYGCGGAKTMSPARLTSSSSVPHRPGDEVDQQGAAAHRLTAPGQSFAAQAGEGERGGLAVLRAV